MSLGSEMICISTQERSQEGEKRGFIYACAEYYKNAAKQSWTTLRMSRLVFVGSYFQDTRWDLGQ